MNPTPVVQGTLVTLSGVATYFAADALVGSAGTLADLLSISLFVLGAFLVLGLVLGLAAGAARWVWFSLSLVPLLLLLMLFAAWNPSRWWLLFILGVMATAMLVIGSWVGSFLSPSSEPLD